MAFPRRQSADRGFSLIELLVVIVVLAVLATIVVFAVGGLTNRGEVSALEADARTLDAAEGVFEVRNGRFGTEQELVDGGYLRGVSRYHDIEIDAEGEYHLIEVGGDSDAGSGATTTSVIAAAQTTTSSSTTSTPSTTSTSAPTSTTSTTSTSTSSTSPTSTTTTSTSSSTSSTTSSTSVAPSTTQAPAGGVTCSVVVTNGWGSGGNADLTITNNTATALTTWTVRITRNGYGISLWNATDQSNGSTYVTATNLGWNGGVAARSSNVATGATITGSNIATGISFPCAVLTNSVSASNVSCTFKLTDGWGTGGNGNLTLTNNNTRSLSGWSVRISRSGNTISLWSADNQVNDGSYFTAANQSHNASVAAGATTVVTGGGVTGSGLNGNRSFPCAVTSAS